MVSRFMWLVLLLFPSVSYAYLDPGTASLILQGIIGGIAAAMGVASLYWQRIKGWFSRTKNSEESDQE